MSETWHIGRKAIINYLREFIDAPQKYTSAWIKVLRWRKRYGLPIERHVNGSPYIDEAIFRDWHQRFLTKRSEAREK